MFHPLKLNIFALLLVPCTRAYNVAPKDRYEDPDVRKKFAEFYCFKLKTCTAGGDKVCTFDEHDANLAEFEDKCTLYTANCKGKGYFLPVDMAICIRQKIYESENNITNAPKFTTKQPTMPYDF